MWLLCDPKSGLNQHAPTFQVGCGWDGMLQKRGVKGREEGDVTCSEKAVGRALNVARI